MAKILPPPSAGEGVELARDGAKASNRKPLRRVLVALDGSRGAARSLEFALELSRQYGSELILCTVLDHAQQLAAASMPDIVYPSLSVLLEQYDAVAQLLLQEASAQALAAGARSSSVTLEGRPAAAIVRYATSRSVDAIVMGTHGKRGLERAFLGSTAEGVLRLADVPVLVVRQAADAARDGTMPPAPKSVGRILVAVDDSDPSDAAIAFAFRLASAEKSALLCCTVIETGQLVDNAQIYGCDPAPYVREARDAALALLAAKTELPLTNESSLERVILEGEPADGILAAAEDAHADLIVCGTHGRRGLRRMLVGSVAESIVRRSTLPVAVIRTNSFPSG